ncbi:MAG: acyltransferase [Hymenobacter sp.]|nr:MAG: acyltransferase [Hymenobacter sp.]
MLPTLHPPTSSETTTPHLGLLDGLRGVAAIAVVLFHFLEIAIPDPEHNVLAHAYLAVDFFFCLSGFVIAGAYDTRLQTMGVLAFFRRRLIRLHPLVVVGSLIGWLTFRFDPFSNLYATYAAQSPWLLLSSCLLIPYPIVPERFLNLFHLNPPTWSLFWEYVANLAYGLVLVRLRPVALGVLTLLAAGAVCHEVATAGSLSGGWSRDTAAAGAVRVAYSFLIGMVVYRTHWRLRSRLGFVSLSLLLAAAFLIPFVKEMNWLTDSLVVLCYFPLLVALGASAQPAPHLAKLCQHLGSISYPLYMVHYPFLWVFLSYHEQYHPSTGTLALVIPLAILGLGLLAWAVLTWVDAPIRSYLTRTFGKPTSSNHQA